MSTIKKKPYRPGFAPRGNSVAKRVHDCLLEHGRLSYEDIAEEIGANPNSVRSALHHWHRRCFRVSGWECDGSLYAHPRALWSVGTAYDMPRPPDQPRVEINRRSRARRACMVNSVFALGARA